jgi:carbon storage regulator CsrA
VTLIVPEKFSNLKFYAQKSHCIFKSSPFSIEVKLKSGKGTSGMLIISRKKDQKIVVADDIEITILEVGRNRVRFGIKAPRHVPIHTRLKNTPAESPEHMELAEQIFEMPLDDVSSFMETLPATAMAGKRR